MLLLGVNRGKWNRYFWELEFNMWLLSECGFNFVEISYSRLQTHYSTELRRRTQFMVVIQENKSFF